MIEAVKKRYKLGDEITIHTTETSFTGKLDAFEDTCVIIITAEGEEFISNEDIKRVSVPKKEETHSEISPINEIPKVEAVKIEIPKVEIIPKLIELKSPSPQYKVGDKIPLKILEERTDKKVKLPKFKGKSTLTLDSLSDLSKLILPELEAENKKVVPANGVITNFNVGNSIYGFITDGKGNKIWFSPAGIIDSERVQFKITRPIFLICW